MIKIYGWGNVSRSVYCYDFCKHFTTDYSREKQNYFARREIIFQFCRLPPKKKRGNNRIKNKREKTTIQKSAPKWHVWIRFTTWNEARCCILGTQASHNEYNLGILTLVSTLLVNCLFFVKCYVATVYANSKLAGEQWRRFCSPTLYGLWLK